MAFHHAVGRGMSHADAAAENLRAGHPDLADAPDEDVRPAGVTADGTFTYEVVAEFESGVLPAVEVVLERYRTA